jgi:hypothetical protein
MQECVGTGRRQRVEPDLAVVGLTPPGILVVGAIRDEQEEPRRGHAVDELIQEGLGLRVDPVQVFTDQHDRLLLAFPQHQTFERVKGPLPALRGIEPQEQAVVRQRLQQRQQRRDGVLEALVEGEHLPGHLGPDGVCVIVLVNMAIALEQLNHREIGGGLAI